MFETAWQDIRYALRSLLRTPAFTLAAVLTLVVGIGANTAMFSVVNAVLLQPLPYPDPDRIVMLVTSTPDGSVPVDSAARFEAWRGQVNTLADVSAYRPMGVNVTAAVEPEQIVSLQVSDNFFRLFGARLSTGRAFTVAEYRGEGARPVVLANGFWRRRFSADAQAVGRTISLDGVPHVVVGVLGAGFATSTLPLVPTTPTTDVIVPLPPDDDVAPVRYLIGAARLKAGVTLAQANAQARTTADAWRRDFPSELDPEDTLRVEPLEDAVVGGVRQPLLLLLAAVGFVLLIACANVANLLLMRGSMRRREIAIRTALGASTGRIVRQLLSESAVLSAAAGSLGLLLGSAAARLILTINPSYLPRLPGDGSTVPTDWRVFVFAASVSLFTAVTCGVLPAWQARHPDLDAALDERRRGSERDPRLLRGMLVVGETAAALVLVIGAALLMRSFVALRTVEPGFDSRGIVNVPMTLAGPRFEKTAAVAEVVRDGVARLRGIPGVTAAAAGCCPPMLGRYQLPFAIVGRPPGGPSQAFGGWVNVSPGYFDVFKVPLIRGRTFTDFDTAGAPGVVVINQTMARRFWSGDDPLRDRLLIGQGFGPAEEPARQIIGIVGDVRDGSLDNEPVPMMYVPTAQMPDSYTALHARVPILWFVRSDIALGSLEPVLARELRAASGGVPAGTTMTRSMDELMMESTAAADAQTALMTIFAGSALLLAAVGVYGVAAYSVQQRVREIGIRLALGARSDQVRNMVVAQGMRLVLLGVALGAVTAFGVTRLLAGLLFGVSPRDPLVFVAVPILIVGVAAASVWLPARRAAALDPVASLRMD